MSQSKTKLTDKQVQMRLDLPNLKPIEQEFDGGQVCSDGGLLILRKADQVLGLCENASVAMSDNRRPDLIKHSILDMFRQRISESSLDMKIAMMHRNFGLMQCIN